MKNKIMLITYSDSFGKNLKELKQMVDTYFKREINGIHILPFFPSSGDRGFAPINYREVDPQFGTWEDIQALAEDYELMFDFMINHLSRRSPEFLDFWKSMTSRNMRICSCALRSSGRTGSRIRSRWIC